MTRDKLLDRLKKSDTEWIEWTDKCHDCGKPVDVEAKLKSGHEVEITGGAVYEVKDSVYLKCDSCFEKDKSLRNYQDCEVYSRVVGYLRPVSQWNPGKQEEFKDRKMFDPDRTADYLQKDEPHGQPD